MATTEPNHCPSCGEVLSSPNAECVHCLLDLGSTKLLNDDFRPDSGTPFEQRVFGDYEVLDEIARGGMGVVYRARQRSLDRIVALKLILSGQLATRELVHRFRVEASTAGALQHPNIVAIHEVGVHDGNHFFSMDYVEGQNLDQLVGIRPLPPKKAARYLKVISEAIHYAHEQGILHRDLKPSNVLVDALTNQPRVTDFGLAKRLDGESRLTMTGQVLGSPQFMPPEQASPQLGKVGRRSDVYALGSILYFLLCARPPFQGESLEMILGQVLNTEPVSPRLLNPNVPRDLETVCLKCLEKEPDRRYQSAQAMAEDLSRFLQNEPTLARPITLMERTWRWCRLKPAFAGLVFSVVILFLTLAIGSPIVAIRIQKAREVAEANLYAADLNVVQTVLAGADLRYARELLDRHRPTPNQVDHRGFEWRYLWTLCQGDEAYRLEPHVSDPRSLVFSPKGDLLATGSESGDFSVVWNVETKAVAEILPRGDLPMAFHPNAPMLVTGGKNGLKLWNTLSWREQPLGSCHEFAVAVFSPDGRDLIVYGNELRVWDARTWESVSSHPLREINFWVASTLRVSHDGSLLSCADGAPYVTSADLGLFHLPSLDPIPWSEQLPKDIAATAFHPEREILVTGGWSGDIRLWDYSTGQEFPSIMKQPSRIMAMAFSPVDSNLLATTGGDRSIRLWDFEAQEEQMRWHGAMEELDKLAWSPDGQTIATGGHGNPIALWEADRIKTDIITIPIQTRTSILGYSSDGGNLMTIDATGSVMYRDSRSLAESEPIIQVDMESVFLRPEILDFLTVAMGTTRDNHMLAIGMESGHVEIWDLVTRTNFALEAHSARVRGLDFSPDSSSLVTAGKEGAVHLWKLGNHSVPMASAKLDQVSNNDWPLCVRFSPNGELIVVGSGDLLSVFDGSTLRRNQPDIEVGAFLSLRFSPDGRYLVSGNNGSRMILWDTRTWEYRTLPGHELVVLEVAFSRDGRRMVSGSDKLIVWDTETWQQLATYRLPLQDINFITFSPDGNDLVTSDASTLRVWRAASFDEINEQEAREGRWK